MDLDAIETPAVLIDMAIVAHNIRRAQDHIGSLGMAMRPHIKTHKLASIARMQIEAGAQGIACQKLAEAEVFAAQGFRDILLCYNIMGAAKLARLSRLRERADVAVVADSAMVVDALVDAASGAAASLTVLVECDTGLNRCGVQTPEDARLLAERIAAAPGLRFGGLMTYPAPGNAAAVEAFLAEAAARCRSAIGHCDRISTGGTPSMPDAAAVPSATEYRPAPMSSTTARWWCAALAGWTTVR